MFKPVIDYLNGKLVNTGFFNVVHCLVEKITREGQGYPAVCIGIEYKRIELDQKGSLCYWRKNGDVSFAEEKNDTLSCNVQYKTTIPLKLVGFIKNDTPYADCYFADNIVAEIISDLTTTNSALKGLLKAKSARVTAKKYSTDTAKIVTEEYDKVDFEPRYTHAYFSIDFDLIVVSNQNCFNSVCDG